MLLLLVGGDLSVMGRRVIVVEPLSHANFDQAHTHTHTHTHTNPHTFLFKSPVFVHI